VSNGVGQEALTTIKCLNDLAASPVANHLLNTNRKSEETSMVKDESMQPIDFFNKGRDRSRTLEQETLSVEVMQAPFKVTETHASLITKTL
jgi:hypothetical protein